MTFDIPKYHRQPTNRNWAIKPAIDPSNVRFDPGHFRVPIFDPTIDAAESPTPTLIIPLNCAKRRATKEKLFSNPIQSLFHSLSSANHTGYDKPIIKNKCDTIIVPVSFSFSYKFHASRIRSPNGATFLIFIHSNNNSKTINATEHMINKCVSNRIPLV